MEQVYCGTCIKGCYIVYFRIIDDARSVERGDDLVQIIYEL